MGKVVPACTSDYLADPTSPIPSHCASIVAASTVRVKRYTAIRLGLMGFPMFSLLFALLYPRGCILFLTHHSKSEHIYICKLVVNIKKLPIKTLWDDSGVLCTSVRPSLWKVYKYNQNGTAKSCQICTRTYHNTSSPTEMLEQLEQEYLKRHRTIPSQNFLMAINFPSIIIPSLSRT